MVIIHQLKELNVLRVCLFMLQLELLSAIFYLPAGFIVQRNAKLFAFALKRKPTVLFSEPSSNDAFTPDEIVFIMSLKK